MQVKISIYFIFQTAFIVANRAAHSGAKSVIGYLFYYKQVAPTVHIMFRNCLFQTPAAARCSLNKRIDNTPSIAVLLPNPAARAAGPNRFPPQQQRRAMFWPAEPLAKTRLSFCYFFGACPDAYRERSKEKVR